MIYMSKEYVFERGVDEKGNSLEVLGNSFFRSGKTGFTDSIAAVQAAGELRAPTYMFAEALAASKEENDPLRRTRFDSNGEVDVVVDMEGALGKSGECYAIEFQLGGIVVNNPTRIQEALDAEWKPKNWVWKNRLIPLTKDEVRDLFQYIRNNDLDAFEERGWLQGQAGSNYIFRDIGDFRAASSKSDFLRNTPGYVVVTPFRNFSHGTRGYDDSSLMQHDEQLEIRSGGKENLLKMLHTLDTSSLGRFGSYRDRHLGQYYPNSGSSIEIQNNQYNVKGFYNSFDVNGHSVGLSAEALEARAKIVSPQREEMPKIKREQDLRAPWF